MLQQVQISYSTLVNPDTGIQRQDNTQSRKYHQGQISTPYKFPPPPLILEDRGIKLKTLTYSKDGIYWFSIAAATNYCTLVA